MASGGGLVRELDEEGLRALDAAVYHEQVRAAEERGREGEREGE